ncbi:VOC family protein [Nocardioides panaciterrulae]|uniref:Putative enzyme related to lactoylglutathione lyase n=1 Tax=Nocardioides panaciterrulae TaxID=661492 RepID=A0A7Y9E867_9ACTN|nr:putative enzyme related to lactoylglutathione lyase [Nocardioides panaciterrulae]
MTTACDASTPVGPFWITAFLDLAPEEHGRAVAFWQGVTGYDRSPARGERGEFVTLLPGDGDDYLRVQRLGGGASRIHLDLHVVDLDRAVRRAGSLGARVVGRPPQGYLVLESPGGFVFCLVRGPASQRPRPVRWPGGHHSAVDQVCLDVPASPYAGECRFWSELTGWALTGRDGHDEFARLGRDDRLPIRFLLRRLEEPTGPVRAHLGLATTDRAAETARHEELGATVLDPDPRGWTVLHPPAGPAYCLAERTP